MDFKIIKMEKNIIKYLVIIFSYVTYVVCFPETETDFVVRLKRELSDPDLTTQTPEKVFTQSDLQTNYQEVHSDTNLHDPTHMEHNQGDMGHLQGDTSHLHGDTGHSSAHEGHGEIGTSSGSQQDSSSQSDYKMISEHTNTHDSHMQHNTRTDFHNPLHMTRPGEAPPRFMSNIQNNQPESMPQALPMTQAEPISDTTVDKAAAEASETGGADPGYAGTTGDFPHTENTDTPKALPQTQDYTPEASGQPMALPQRQGTSRTRSRPTSKPVSKRPIQGQRSRPQSRPRARQENTQGQRSRPQPRPRPREGNQQSTQQVRGSSSDVLAAAAILNSDVHDTVADGMEMVAKQQAIDQLDRQLSGSQRDRLGPDWQQRGRGRADTGGRRGPDWGTTQQSPGHRGDRRGTGGHADPLDTLAQVHSMKAKADIVQDHVDTVQDIHQDQTDYMYGRRDYDPRYYHGYDRSYPHNPTYRGGRMPSSQNFDSSQSRYNSYMHYPPYNSGRGGSDRHYHREEEDYYHGYAGYQPGFKLDINTGLPCNNMSDPKCQMQGYREIQIETPHGEMDMEPGELDLEGPAAANLLRTLGIIQSPGVTPINQEININHNVLAALQSRFGINNTADIRRMSANRDFQAFMYQVLTLSGQVAPGEYNANLTKAQVDRILANHGPARPRLRTANLDHAKLVIDKPTGGSSDNSQTEAVLTIDGGPGPNTNNMGIPMIGNIPGVAAPLVQNGLLGQTGSVAQPSSVAALVQTILGGGEEMRGGEAGEGTEGTGGNNGTQTSETSEKTLKTETSGNETTKAQKSVTETSLQNTNNALNQSTSIPQQQTTSEVSDIGNATQNVGSHAATFSPQSSQNNSSTNQETHKVGKDANPKFSKDNVTKANETVTRVNDLTAKVNKVNAAVNAAGTGAGSNPSGAGAGTGNGLGSSSTGAGAGAEAEKGVGLGTGTGSAGVNAGAGPGGQGGAGPENLPIGLAEAGIDPSAQDVKPTNQIPTEAIERGYKASTAFAIAAVTLIALAIIIGPILCLLCKMREKAAQRRRKEKALKNRDVSENNIMEAMMLHDFGPEAPNFVSNKAAEGLNYYKTEREYHDIDEIEALKPGRMFPTGHLP